MNKYILLLVVLGYGLIVTAHLGLFVIEDPSVAAQNYIYNFKVGAVGLFAAACLKVYEGSKS